MIKKGQPILSEIPYNTTFSLCFVDLDEKDKVIDEIVNKFGKECIYLVNSGDSRLFEDKYNVKAAPLSSQNLMYLDRFKIKSFPSKITKITKFLTLQTLDIEQIRFKYRRKGSQ